MSEPRKRKRKGERPDGRIQVTLTIGIDESGKPIRKSFYGSTRKEAEAKRNAYTDDVKAGLNPLHEDITLEDWIDQWIKLYDIDMTWKQHYANRLKRDLGKVKLRDITEAHLYQSLHDGYNGKSTGAASAYRNFMRNLFRKAVKNHLITENPSDELDLPKTSANSHRALEQWEIDCLLKHHRLAYGGMLALFMLLTGTRRGECLALNWDTSIDMEHRLFHIHSIVDYYSDYEEAVVVNRTKTKAGVRSIPMCQALFDLLNEIPPHERHGLLFSTDGKPINYPQFRVLWKQFLDAINNQLLSKAHGQTLKFSCTPHDLRHTYATLLYDAGVDVKTAQSYLGHSSSKMTMELYTHLSKSRKNHSEELLLNYLNSMAAAKSLETP